MATTVDIVVYGGGFAGVAAAAKAAANTASNKTIALIVPDPVPHDGRGSCLGGLGTIGGQNYFDIRTKDGVLFTQGTFNWWYKQQGLFYSTDAMASMAARSSITMAMTLRASVGALLLISPKSAFAALTEIRPAALSSGALSLTPLRGLSASTLRTLAG